MATRSDKPLAASAVASGGGAMILRLVRGARERRAIEAGQVDAVLDAGSGGVILLPEAQAALLSHGTRLRSLLELTSDGYWEQDEQFRFTVHSGIAIGGGPADGSGVLGRQLWELPFENHSEIDWQAHRTQLQWRAVFRDLQLRFTDEAGRLRSICVSGEPRFDTQGEFTGYRGIVREDTVHGAPASNDAATEALRRSEAKYRSLVELSVDWWWEQDVHFRYTSMTGAGMACIRGILGKTLWEVPGIVLDDEYGWVKHQSELAAQWSFCDLDCAVLRADGQRDCYRISGAPVYSDAGVFTGFHGTGLDITPGRRAGPAVRTADPESADH